MLAIGVSVPHGSSPMRLIGSRTTSVLPAPALGARDAVEAGSAMSARIRVAGGIL